MVRSLSSQPAPATDPDPPNTADIHVLLFSMPNNFGASAREAVQPRGLGSSFQYVSDCIAAAATRHRAGVHRIIRGLPHRLTRKRERVHMPQMNRRHWMTRIAGGAAGAAGVSSWPLAALAQAQPLTSIHLRHV